MTIIPVNGKPFVFQKMYSTPLGEGMFQGRLVDKGAEFCILSFSTKRYPQLGKIRGIWHLAFLPPEQVEEA